MTATGRVPARVVAIYGMTNIVSAALGVALLAVLTRLLSPAGYGVYAVVGSAVAVGQTTGFHWLQTAVLRYRSGPLDAAGRARLGASARLGYLRAAAVAALVWVAAALLGARVVRVGPGVALAALLLLLARAWLGVVQGWNRASERPWRFVTVEAASGLGTLAIATLGLRARPGDPLVPLLAAAGAALLAAVLSPELVRPVPGVAPAPAPRVAELWAYGAPLSVVALASIVLAVSDRLLLAAMHGAAAAGAYAASAAVAERAVGLPLTAIALATKPLVFGASARHGAESAGTLLAHIAAWLMAAGFPVTTLLVAAPEPVASLLVGGGMAPDAAAALPWLASGALLAAFTSVYFALAFQVTRRTTGMVVALVPAAVLNVAANLLLLPRYGAIAAAWTTFGSQAVAAALALGLGRRLFRVPLPARDAARTALACVPLALVVRAGRGSTGGSAVVLLAAAAAVYLLSAFALDVGGVRRAAAALRR